MFADVDADIYVLADPEGAYDPADAPSLVNALITERVDMVIGTRRGAIRSGRRAQGSFGDRAFDWLYRRFFAAASTDIVSGYRAFTRRFVKSFPAIATGFDIEIELSMHASQLMIPVAEIELSDGRAAPAQPDPASVSDSLRGLTRLAILLKETRPFYFFAIFAVVFWGAGLALTVPILTAQLEGDTVASLSNALVGMSMFVAGFVMGGCGLILDALGRSRVEQKRVLFLTVPGLGAQ